MPRLTSRRLELDPIGEADVDVMHALWTDPDVRRYLWDDVVISRERAATVVAASAADFRTHRFGLWAARLKGCGDVSGFCGLRSPPDLPELLYGFRREYWRRGYATEAAEGVLAYAFDALRIRAVGAATDAPNLASIRVLERLGMRVVKRELLNGLDPLFYALTREEFYSRRARRSDR
jgi:ribosomal-protein-alanine N-acetyltransferase